MRLFILIFIILTVSQKQAETSNILAVFPVADQSSHVAYQRLLKGLADAGHDVTLISPYEYWENLSNGSVRDVILTGFDREYEKILPNLYATSNSSGTFKHTACMQAYLPIYKKLYQHPNLKWFLKSNLKFDAFITDNVYAPSLLAFGAIFNCPTIIFSPSIGPNPLLTDMVLSPAPLSYARHTYLHNSQWWNMQNFISFINDNLFKYLYLFPEHRSILQQAGFKQDVSSLYHNVSLILLGGHETSFLPNMVQIGGYHLQSINKLPKDLQETLDASSAVIYVHLQDITQDEALELLKAFGNLNTQIIWNYAEKLSGDTPKNLLVTTKEFSNEILGHPNLKLSISNADYISIIEAVHQGVPALVIPRTPQQLSNAAAAESKGYALKLSRIEASSLSESINFMLDSDTYRKVAQKVSKEFNRWKISPLDKAVAWVEYIISHQGAQHLGVPKVNVPNFYVLDVALVGMLVCLGGGLGWVFGRICGGKRVVKGERKKKKKRM